MGAETYSLAGLASASSRTVRCRSVWLECRRHHDIGVEYQTQRQHSALSFSRPCFFNRLVNLAGCESVGPFPFGLFADNRRIAGSGAERRTYSWMLISTARGVPRFSITSEHRSSSTRRSKLPKLARARSAETVMDLSLSVRNVSELSLSIIRILHFPGKGVTPGPAPAPAFRTADPGTPARRGGSASSCDE